MLSFFFQVVENYKHQNRNSIFRNQQSSFICQILRSFRIICRQTYIVFGHYMQSFNKMVNKRRKDRIPRHVKRRMCHIGVLKKKKKTLVFNLEWKYVTGKTTDFCQWLMTNLMPMLNLRLQVGLWLTNNSFSGIVMILNHCITIKTLFMLRL